jgi:hypothetical protein
MDIIISDLNIINDATQQTGHMMYRKYCNTCFKIFNLFDFMEKHHNTIKEGQQYIDIYFNVRELVNKYIDVLQQLLVNRTSCHCDTWHVPVVQEKIVDGQQRIVAYDEWSPFNKMFLYYDAIKHRPFEFITQEFQELLYKEYQDSPVEGRQHPLLTTIVNKPRQNIFLPENPNDIYDAEYRLHYRLLNKNFLRFDFYLPDMLFASTHIRVSRDIILLKKELSLWKKYFDQPHGK